ncbi:ATPase component BioM of energizing module of biotin ECF transporter [hydrothermal vent metagenome]|uniref:ATPase component BioM of energizing module of biotin ECF transporter n=1 Tax=hydrothermal vent metagenome TaxID=652676 RepID=A0A1W1C8V8_9ZZZZ
MKTILENSKRLYRLKRNQILPLYQRFLFDSIKNSKAKITGLYGGRGVGKTTLLLQVLKELDFKEEEKLYISCDHPMFQEVSLFDFVDEFSKFGGEVIVIDEIHKIEDFQIQIKMIYDFLSIKVYFSGSSAVEITNADFSRRYSMYHLPILSLREFLELTKQLSLSSYSLEEILFNHENIAHKIIDSLNDKKILKHFQQFINVGVYPFYFEDESRYIDRVHENINTILYTDLVNVVKIDASKIESLKRLLLSICVSNPLEITMEKLAKTVGITKPTLYKYISYLGRAELLHHIVFDAKRFQNLQKPDKLYLNNTNLFNALCINSNIGTIRETFFVSMLYKQRLVNYATRGDFLIDEKYTFEVGGKNKGFKQIKDLPNSFVVADDIEIGSGNKIPLWLFGFLY